MGVVDKYHTQQGFTIAELIIVIVVIGILATVSIVGYGSWRTSTAKSEVQSNLNGVVSAMESARGFNNGYPVSIPSTIQQNNNVTLAYVRGDSSSYCIGGTSTVRTSVVYYVDSRFGSDPKEGACPATITNTMANPSAELGVTAPHGGYYSPVITVDTTKAAFGTRSLKATTNSTINPQGMIWRADNALASTQYKCSISLTGTAGSVVQVGGRIATAAGGYISEGLGATNLTLSAAWQRTSVTFTTTSTTGIVYLQYRLTSPATAIEIWGDGAMCSTNTSTYGYADGDSQYWVWDGTPHNSTSSGPAL
jgi:prepilin-type N-terminal cleavage/methylation domain-containing protein